MKTFIFMAAIFAALLFLATVAQAAANIPISTLQKQVKQAQAELDQAKEKAELGMSASDKAEWREVEKKFETMVAEGKDSKKISTQEKALMDLETRVITSSGSMEGPRSARVNLDLAREQLVQAYAKLNVAKARLRGGSDDSSQAIQPENRTQNGSNFSIRSQRDSENHPPLPASQ